MTGSSSVGNDFSNSLSTLGGLGGIYNATQSQTPGSIIQGLSGANTAANSISNLTGNGNLTSPDISQGLGAAAGGLGIYNAINNPTPGNIIGGAAGGVNLANNVSNLATGSSIVPGAVGSTLGDVGAGLGLYNAIQNPSNPIGDIQGALDAYKLYNAVSGLTNDFGGAASSAASTAGTDIAGMTAGNLAGLGTGLGILGYGIYSAITGDNAISPLQDASELSQQVLSGEAQSIADTGGPGGVYATDLANEAAGGVAPVTPFTGTTNDDALAWLQASGAMAGGGGRLGGVTQGQY